MNERERLIEWLYNIPPMNINAGGRQIGKRLMTMQHIADHLLANGVIVPPCKVGDTVYYLTTVDTDEELNVTDIFCGTMQSVGFDGKNIWLSVKYKNGLYYAHTAKDFGKTVFLTKAEAEKALAERGKQ